jgi:hypothetical protein
LYSSDLSIIIIFIRKGLVNPKRKDRNRAKMI